MSVEDFVDELSLFIHRREADFRSKPTAWHERVCSILSSAAINSVSDSLLPKISQLPIVPLSGVDEWIAPTYADIYFPPTGDQPHIPRGLGVFEVSADVAASERSSGRRTLFVTLGVKSYDSHAICETIIETHESAAFQPSSLSIQDMVSHVLFLNMVGWESPSSRPKLPNLWVATADGSRCRTRSVYLELDPETDPFGATSVFNGHRSRVHFLHEQYEIELSRLGVGGNWRLWLVGQFGVALLPRLARDTGGLDFTMSDDFRHLVDTKPLTALLLLREKWQHYRTWIVPSEDENHYYREARASSRRDIWSALSGMMVPCREGGTAPLGNTFLPRKSVVTGLTFQRDKVVSTLTPSSATKPLPRLDPHLAGSASVPAQNEEGHEVPPLEHTSKLLDVPDPENLSWNFLSCLGVIIKLELTVFLDRLRQLKEIRTDISKDEVAAIYELIENQCVEHGVTEEAMGKLRDTVETEELLYIHPSNNETGERWISIGACVWTGPSFLKNVCRLREYYPTRSRLFNGILGCPDITSYHPMGLAYVVREAHGIKHNDDLKYIQDVFLGIAEQVRHGVPRDDDKEAVYRLRKREIFPTRRGTESTSIPSYHLRSASESEHWYIPDHPQVAPVFADTLDYLAFHQTVWDALSPLFDLLGIQDRRLSLASRSQTVAEGRIRSRNFNCASLVKRRMRFIVKKRSATTSQGTTQPKLAFLVEARKLKLFIAAQGSGLADVTYELASELAKFCHINGSEHSILLMLILTSTEEKSIEFAFRRQGFSVNAAIADEAVLDNGKKNGNGNEDNGNKDVPNKLERKPPRDTPGKDALHERHSSSALDTPQAVEAEKKPTGDPDPPHDQLGIKEETPNGRSKVPEGNSESRGSVISRAGQSPKSDPDLRRIQPTAFVNTRSGVITVHEPQILFFCNQADDEWEFYGELHVSKFLALLLGREYDATKHWTSRFRTRNGFKEMKLESDGSTFTIPEGENGNLSKLLVSNGAIPRRQLRFPCTFHIEVCCTAGGLASPFALDGHQLNKWKELSLEKNKQSTDVCILARVYNVHSHKPGIILYADPWKIQHMLSLRADLYYGTVPDSLPTLITHEAVKLSPDVQDTDKIYEDLDVGPSQIRLLKLDLGGDDGRLSGMLTRTSVESPSVFWAISYFWGPKAGGSTFTTDRGSILITESLATCLATLRSEGVDKPLWADAVCINQNNDVEKAMQVRRMGSLYESASRVIVWMGRGENEDNTSTAIELLTALHAEECDICREKQNRLWRLSFRKQASQLRATSRSAFGQDDRDPIVQLLYHDWFTRTWIIQELILGSLGADVTIKCGHSEIKWACFVASLVEYERRLVGMRPGQLGSRVLSNNGFLPNVPAVIALERSRRDYNCDIRKSFLELLEMFAYARSTQRRDKLFALLNLANDWPPGKMPKEFWPDYQSSEDEVLVSYAKGFVQPGGRMKALDLLYRAGSGKSCRFCTWIPDLMDERGTRKYPPTISNWKAAGSGQVNDHVFRACGPVPTVASINPAETGTYDSDSGRVLAEGAGAKFKPPVLAIRGYVVDFVEGLQPLRIGYTLSSLGESRITFMDAWEDLLAYTKLLSTYPGRAASDDWRVELLVKLLIGDARGPCVPNLDLRLHVWDERQWRETEAESSQWPDNLAREVFFLEAGQDANKLKERPIASQTLLVAYWQTAKAFTDLIPGATYCTTKGSYAGIVPGATETGDMIFIPYGAAVPFVIRPDGGTSYYKLIGECYIQGLMYYEKSDKRAWTEKEISLV
ncbi:heterokaryon incompatibility protein 6, OR allele [Achaetomium macrosporum]|uniref:Heterokaryon incompatibility protein 6, OR allele n=1 Tax=Achaetomium macrosporum TaxID=79813 RepID=A0AAN7H906_9PEZI|nr:heterokaryon incompatibility protein 6, OR allele [Achaetomium macrosporum]